MLEITLEASCGLSVRIVAGSVVAFGLTVTVTVTVGVGAGADSEGRATDVKSPDKVDESVPSVEPEAPSPAMPPLAPVALIMERALFSLVQVKIVPFD